MKEWTCPVCPRCGHPSLIGTGMLSFGGNPEKLVCLRCGALLDGGEHLFGVPRPNAECAHKCPKAKNSAEKSPKEVENAPLKDEFLLRTTKGFVDALEAYGYHLRLKDCSDSTVKNYTRLVGSFVRWWEKVVNKPFDLPAVTPADVADFKRHLLASGRRPATINLCVEALRSFFSWAVVEGLCASNPARNVRRVREYRWLSRKEIGLLARAVQKYGGPRDQAFLGLLIHAGLRVSELVGLKTANIVLRERSGFAKVWGKGMKYREVPLNITARKALQEWLAVHPGGKHLFPG